ncbi:uncharacterized protein LOC117174720 isoform X2 [Belonocnema kinseyi]|uniref:uncharacterized protein LOC117174720 isoform X2 n=1 Tax=Belonocnema kinseyi TaxID=2817044 RepID=UPI00143DB523|nr:uncharacterized protein LOC117174720 isoform X2 [Belonocnema kinseyi]
MESDKYSQVTLKPTKYYNQVVKKMIKDKFFSEKEQFRSDLIYSQPQCFAPHVDVTRAKCGFGRGALPRLKKELQSNNPLVVRRAVTTISDLIFRPEELFYAIELQIPERLANFLESDDSYLRERVGMTFKSIAAQSIGRDLIVKNVTIVQKFAQGLRDRLAAVRIRMAETIEMLARSWVAEKLCTLDFVDLIADIITFEKKDILIIHLETLLSLFNLDVKKHAIEIGVFEKLVLLLERKDENILTGTLACLAMLCREQLGKAKALEMDLLSTLKDMLNDERRPIHTKAVNIIAFVTITTPGKLRALELQIMSRLLYLVSDHHSQELQLMALKTLTNIAEAPEGRMKLLKGHLENIKDIKTCNNEDTERHKQILLDVIQWKP